MSTYDETDANARSVEARFNASFGKSPVGTAILAPSGEFLHVNQALCDLIGYRAEDLVGTSFRYRSPRRRPARRDQMTRLLRARMTLTRSRSASNIAAARRSG